MACQREHDLPSSPQSNGNPVEPASLEEIQLQIAQAQLDRERIQLDRERVGLLRDRLAIPVGLVGFVTALAIAIEHVLG